MAFIQQNNTAMDSDAVSVPVNAFLTRQQAIATELTKQTRATKAENDELRMKIRTMTEEVDAQTLTMREENEKLQKKTKSMDEENGKLREQVGKLGHALEANQEALQSILETIGESLGVDVLVLALPDVSILEGLKVQPDGTIMDREGSVIGKLIEGNPDRLSKKMFECDATGAVRSSKKKGTYGRAQTVVSYRFQKVEENDDLPVAEPEELEETEIIW